MAIYNARRKVPVLDGEFVPFRVEGVSGNEGEVGGS